MLPDKSFDSPPVMMTDGFESSNKQMIHYIYRPI